MDTLFLYMKKSSKCIHTGKAYFLYAKLWNRNVQNRGKFWVLQSLNSSYRKYWDTFGELISYIEKNIFFLGDKIKKKADIENDTKINVKSGNEESKKERKEE